MVVLSIIIPVYNAVKYLSGCLDSILKQNDVSFELLLIDDGSKDGSGEICDKYALKDERVKVVHQSNQGASHARNVGLEMASGEWISFVDADDWVATNYLKIFHDFGTKADITFFPCQELFFNGCSKIRRMNNIFVNTRPEIESVIYDLKYGSIGDIFGWTVAKFLRASLIKENLIHFKEDLVFREDEIFTMDVCRYVQSVQVLDSPIYNYRILNTGLTGNGILLSDYLVLASNLERNLSFFRNKEFLSRECQRIADYHIEYFRKTARIRNLHQSMEGCHAFFREKPQYIQCATNRRVAKMLSHSYLVSYLLLLFDMLLEAVQGKLH